MCRGMGVWAARAANRAHVIRRERIGEDSSSILGDSTGSFRCPGRMTSNSEVKGEDRAYDAIEIGFWQAAHSDRSVLKQCSRGTPFRQLKWSVARLFRQSTCNLIPRIERLPQGELRFDSFLDLVKRETEFTRRTTWSSAPRVGSPRGKYRTRCGSISVPGA